MSVEAIDRVLRGDDGRAVAIPHGASKYVGAAAIRNVLFVLADHADRSGLAWPSQMTIASESALDRRAVGHALAVLERLGHIVRVAASVPRQRGTTYQLPVNSAGIAPQSPAGADGELGGEITTETVIDSAGNSAVMTAGISPHEPEPEVSSLTPTHVANRAVADVLERAVEMEIARDGGNAFDGSPIRIPRAYTPWRVSMLQAEYGSIIERRLTEWPDETVSAHAGWLIGDREARDHFAGLAHHTPSCPGGCDGTGQVLAAYGYVPCTKAAAA